MNKVKIVEGVKFNTTTGVESKGVKVIRRIKLLPYKEGKGYTVVTCKHGNIWEVTLRNKGYKNAPATSEYNGCMGCYGGVWYLKAKKG